MPVTLGVIGLGVTAGQAIYGAIQKDKARKAAAANVRPTYTIPGEEYRNENLAESLAGEGLSAGAQQYLTNQNDRSQSAAYSAILKGGGDGNAIAGAADKFQNGAGQVALYDDQARMNNLNRLQSAWLRMSADKDKAWQVNQYGPYADRAAAIGQQLAGSQQQFNSGLNGVGSSLLGGVNSYMRNRQNQINPVGSNAPDWAASNYNFNSNTPEDVNAPGYNPLG